MPAITSLGIGSGLDLNSLVNQLTELERRPLAQMQTQARSLQTQVSNYGRLTSLFSSLQTAASKLTGATVWTQTKASSSDASAVSVSGGAGAAAGSYAVRVQQLAGSQTVASGIAFSSSAEMVGSGTLTIELGAWREEPPDTYPPMTFVPTLGGGAVLVDVTASDTLATLRDKINATGAGVTASIITDSSGARLSLRSTATGAENAFRVQVDDTSDGDGTDASGLSRFAFDPPNQAPVDPANPQPLMRMMQPAQNALATVNSIPVESASNEVNSVVEGVKLRLHRQTSVDVDVTVTQDADALKAAITDFAKAYNELAKTIADQTKYDPTSKVGGPLQGDSAVGSLQRQLRSVLNTPSGASSVFPRLSDIGLEIQRDGTLSVNDAKLDQAMVNLPELRKAFSTMDSADSTNNGFARRYQDLASQVLGIDGSLTTRTEGLRQRLQRNSTEQDKLNDRVERFQQRLVAQYTAMDANVARLNSLSSYLTQQLDSLSRLYDAGKK